MRDRLQQELCQADFGRKRVTKLQSRLTFCHGRLFFSHFCCMDRKNVLHLHSERPEDGHTVDVAQLVRASDCGSEGRGFEPLLPPEEVSSKRGDLFFFASVRACRLGSLNARCARHLPHPTPGLCTARRSKRLPTATQPGLRPSTTESPDPRRNRFKGRTPFQPPPPLTDEPPPADKRAFRPTAAARIQRPYAAPRCTSRFATTGPSSATGTTRTSTSTSATGTGPAQAPRSGTKKQPSPRWGRLSSLCSNRLRGRSHGAEARS